MTKLTSLTAVQIEAICGGNGWRLPRNVSMSTSVFSMASYRNLLNQSSAATNVVIGGGRNSFAGVINEQGNLSEQGIAAFSL